MSNLNPELQRNLWLELSPKRLVIVPVILLLLLSPWLVLPNNWVGSTADAARMFYYAIVVVWGTRIVAGSVIGEIRGRTWDLQRLSSLSAGQMLWGKLIGSPILVWYAGGLCLLPITLEALAEEGLIGAFQTLAYFLSVGLFAHSVSLLTSLLSIRKKDAQSWLDSFLFQIAGIVAGAVAATTWTAATETRLFDTITWFGMDFSAPTFTLMSLFIFMGWSLIGNWRLMRRELQMPGEPWIWVGFLLFMMAYFAGLADTVGQAEWRHVVRLATAASVAAMLTYVMLFLESKDRVQMRWLLDQLSRGRVDRFVRGLQSWMFAFAATVIVAVLLMLDPTISSPSVALNDLTDLPWIGDVYEEHIPRFSWRIIVMACLLFMARDVGLCLALNFAPRANRGDFIWVLWLVILYAIAPTVLAGLKLDVLLPFFVAIPREPVILMPLWPGIEAALIWGVALRRLFVVDRKSVST